MSQTERRFFSAVTLERAILEAAGHFGVEPERLRYEKVEKRSGFTKRRRVVIKVDPSALVSEEPVREEPRSGPASEAATAQTGIEPAAETGGGAFEPAAYEPIEAGAEEGDEDDTDEDDDEPGEAEAVVATERQAPPVVAVAGRASHEREVGQRRQLARSVEDLVARMPRVDRETERSVQRWMDLLLQLADVRLEAVIRQGEDRIEVHLEGEDAEWLVEDEGEALQAIQTLLSRLLQVELGDAPNCRVDCCGFQEIREEQLRLRAHRAANEVRHSGQRAILEPMMPADRRIVHLALVNDGSVSTESIGRGFFKRVTIKPA